MTRRNGIHLPAASRGPAGALLAACLALFASLTAAAARLPGEASRPSLAADDGALPAAPTVDLKLDYDVRPGATVVGITGTSPLLHHTVFDPGARSTVIEIPGGLTADLPPVAAVGSPEVESVSVEAAGTPRAPIARFVVSRAEGTRRDVTVDPRNARRIELTIHGAAGADSAGPEAEAATLGAPDGLAEAAGAEPLSRAALDGAGGPALESVRAGGDGDGSSVGRPAPVHAPSGVTATAGAEDVVARVSRVSASRAEDGRVLVRVDGSGGLVAQTFELADPPRLVLDLPGAVSDVTRSRVSVRDGGVIGLRIAQNQPLPDPVTRLVIDLEEPLPFQVVPAPGALVVALGGRGGAGAMQGALALPPSAPPAPRQGSLVVTPATAGPAADPLAGAGRPTTSTGAAAPASWALRETAPPPQLKALTTGGGGSTFETKVVADEKEKYTGTPISIHLKDADAQDVFRLLKHYAGVNIVLDSQSLKGKTITLDLTDVPWDQAMAMVLKTLQLGAQLEGNVLRISLLTKLAQEENQRQQLINARESAGELKLVSRQLSYATAQIVEPIVKKSLTQRGQTSVDKRTNTIFIKDIERRVQEVQGLLDLLDRPTRQVMIETRIIETTKDFSKAMGIQWGLHYIADRAFGNATGFSFPRSYEVDYAVNLVPADFTSNDLLSLSFRNILNTFALDLAIAQLEDRSRARIVSAPRVMVANNEKAEIESGFQIPISTTTAAEIQVTFISASLKLEVKPQITADDTVIMDLKIDNNQPTLFTVGDAAPIATRQARTVVAVPDGGTTVIGGIYQVNEASRSNRIPFLSRIPILGWLFRNKAYDRTNDELLIFVTPHIQR